MSEYNINIEIRNDFNQIFGIISYHRQRVSKTIDDESLRMIWEVGGYISHKLKMQNGEQVLYANSQSL